MVAGPFFSTGAARLRREPSRAVQAWSGLGFGFRFGLRIGLGFELGLGLEVGLGLELGLELG